MQLRNTVRIFAELNINTHAIAYRHSTWPPSSGHLWLRGRRIVRREQQLASRWSECRPPCAIRQVVSSMFSSRCCPSPHSAASTGPRTPRHLQAEFQCSALLVYYLGKQGERNADGHSREGLGEREARELRLSGFYMFHRFFKLFETM